MVRFRLYSCSQGMATIYRILALALLSYLWTTPALADGPGYLPHRRHVVGHFHHRQQTGNRKPRGKYVAKPMPHCDFETVGPLPTQIGSTDLGGTPIDYTATTNFLFRRLPDRIIEVDEVSQFMLPDLQAKFLVVIQQNANLPNSDCNTEYHDWNASLGSNGRIASGRLNVALKIWKCTSLDLPCPTWKDPFRFCRQDQRTFLSDGSAHTDIVITPSVSGGKLALVVSSDTSVDVSNDLVKGLFSLGSTIVDPLGNWLTHNLETYIAQQVQAINLKLEPALGDQSSLSGYEPLLTSADFQAGSGGQLILVIKRTSQMKENTACFFQQELQGALSPSS